MDMVLLLKSFVGLIGILLILIFVLMYKPKKAKIENKTPPKKREHYSDDYRPLIDFVNIIKDKKSTAEELQVALDLIIKYHGDIPPKLGIRTHPDFNLYAETIMRICRHPNTNKNLILKFDKELIAKNEEYKREIDDFLSKGLAARGV